MAWRAALLAPALALSLSAAEWTDRGEYDLVMTIRTEASAPKRLEVLDQWKQKYPATAMRQARRELYLSAYLAVGDGPHALDTAKEMIADQPDNLVGLYWCTLLVPEAKDGSPQTWDAGEKSARALLAVAPGQKPAGMTDADWQKRKDSFEQLAHRTLGWIQWQRGDHAAAERELTAYLEKNPNNAEISAWLGMVSGLQNSPEKKVASIWHLARASALRGVGALPEEQRRQFAMLSERTYISYHGNTDGLDQLQASAKAAVFPPAGFTVESAAAITARLADEELKRTNPQLAAWMDIRKQLDSASGDSYFSQTLQTQPLPKLKGTVIRVSPAKRPNEIVLGIRGATEEEVVLHVSTAFRNEADAGTVLEFTGKAKSFSREPFRLTVESDPGQIEGWPEPPRSRK